VTLLTTSLELRPKTRADVEHMIAAMTPYEKAQISARWMAMFRASQTENPWVFGFTAMLRGGVAIGTGGFTGPPEGGVVEIAYAVDEAHRGKGYATEIAQALTDYAFACNEVKVVRAHTLPDGAASKRILAKCGFRHVGEINDPDDGLIWRFEKARGS
jgi:[ribosomal protein S5]-alanine N-acetyltransferase